MHTCETRYADIDYRPALRTPKPRTHGVESATVTGPAGEEIHTDEFGRVRVHFHWDREGAADETSSCWIPVSQAWAGAGFGAISLPRVGQEVLVDFLGADPDRPIVMGRVFTTTTPPPYELPKYKMVSGMRSESYPRPRSAGAPARMGGGPAEALDVHRPFARRSPSMQAPSMTAPAGGGMPMEALGGGEPGRGGRERGRRRIGPAGHLRWPAGASGRAVWRRLAHAVARARRAGSAAQRQRARLRRSGPQRAVYLQSQNDLYMTVKRNFTASVGSNRAYMILGNDYEEIREGIRPPRSARTGRSRSRASRRTW